MKTLLGPFTELLSFQNLPLKGAILDAQLEVINQAGVLIEGDSILSLGTYQELLDLAQFDQVVEFENDHILLPGFVDAHTHICFAGSRSNDFALRNSGSTYLEIA